MKSCATCAFYTPRHSEQGGFCRIEPPTVIPTQRGGDDKPLSVWPYVKEGDWCGEHQEAR